MEHKGWYSRKGLPHFDAGEITQFVTFRLADSLPVEALETMREDLLRSSNSLDRDVHERIESYLDSGFGSCLLREPKCAEMIQNALLFNDGKRFDLKAWVVMPNHVHFLARFEQGQTLSAALHSIKSFTSNQIKRVYPDHGLVWQRESFDRYIRNEEHYNRTVQYIEENPVRARLCSSAELYPFSSSYRPST